MFRRVFIVACGVGSFILIRNQVQKERMVKMHRRRQVQEQVKKEAQKDLEDKRSRISASCNM